MSGSAVSPWAVQKDPLQFADRLAAAVNCSFELTRDMVTCLRYTPADELMQVNTI